MAKQEEIQHVVEKVFIKHLNVGKGWFNSPPPPTTTFFSRHIFKFVMTTFYATLFLGKLPYFGYPPPIVTLVLIPVTSTFSLMISVLAAGPVHTRTDLRPGIRGEHWPLWVNSPRTDVRERPRYTVLC